MHASVRGSSPFVRVGRRGGRGTRIGPSRGPIRAPRGVWPCVEPSRGSQGRRPHQGTCGAQGPRIGPCAERIRGPQGHTRYDKVLQHTH